jgi:hypothetical protein
MFTLSNLSIRVAGIEDYVRVTEAAGVIDYASNARAALSDWADV